jgi:hypothetical protein
MAERSLGVPHVRSGEDFSFCSFKATSFAVLISPKTNEIEEEGERKTF